MSLFSHYILICNPNGCPFWSHRVCLYLLFTHIFVSVCHFPYLEELLPLFLTLTLFTTTWGCKGVIEPTTGLTQSVWSNFDRKLMNLIGWLNNLRASGLSFTSVCCQISWLTTATLIWVPSVAVRHFRNEKKPGASFIPQWFVAPLLGQNKRQEVILSPQ